MSDIGKKIIEGLKDLNDRLLVSGGDINATGLRVTTMRLCECHTYDPLDVPVIHGDPDCKTCGGKGYVRTVNDPTDANN